ncbi:glutathione S-transferase C-terminal domain-containing protein [Sphaerisporangium sp. B11E5]|uniref:glutathione S-transferase family protein n=1 Tax=Sphaerisporangium sp. B11E5 TaxID=3153563 RepID=UPI00325F6A7A
MNTTAPVATPVDFATYGDYTVKSSTTKTGAFARPPYSFRGRITADGSSGFKAEPGRYHLYVCYACPWAHRSIIVRALKKLEDVVTMSAVDPIRDGRGWAFREGEGHTPDPVNGFRLLREAYEASEPGYDGHVSVPVLWDRETGQIVSNNFPDITLDLNTEFTEWSDQTIDLYPKALRQEIDTLNDHIYKTINNGVYRAGFATTQEAHAEAVTTLFESLDTLEKRLTDTPYLFGDTLTESDIRLWVTLVRFDTVYATHFKTNLHHLTDYEALWSYTRRLYAIPAFHTTTNFTHIKNHYYTTHPQLNPSRIVPLGPILDW